MVILNAICHTFLLLIQIEPNSEDDQSESTHNETAQSDLALDNGGGVGRIAQNDSSQIDAMDPNVRDSAQVSPQNVSDTYMVDRAICVADFVVNLSSHSSF